MYYFFLINLFGVVEWLPRGCVVTVVKISTFFFLIFLCLEGGQSQEGMSLEQKEKYKKLKRMKCTERRKNISSERESSEEEKKGKTR